MLEGQNYITINFTTWFGGDYSTFNSYLANVENMVSF
jgi:hypothetical protein